MNKSTWPIFLLLNVLFCSFGPEANAETPPPKDAPKFDAKSLGQLGPEHLQIVYCGAKDALRQMPEHRRRLEALSKDPGTSGLFDAKGKADTLRMLDKGETEAKRIVREAGREFKKKTKRTVADGPCLAYAASVRPPESPILAACHARYRFQVAEKLEAEIRSRDVASEFRERFREKLAKDLEGAREQLAKADAAAKSADASFDPEACRFEKGIAYEPRRAGP